MLPRRSSFLRRTLAALAGIALGGCGAAPPRTAAPPIGAFDDALPSSSAKYDAEPSPSPPPRTEWDQIAETGVRAVLRARGDAPRPDGKLAELAAFIARRHARGFDTNQESVELVARRLGFIGATPWIWTFRAHSAEDLQHELDVQERGLARNVPITRYGITTIERGYGALVVVALNFLDLAVEPLPKRIGVHDGLTLKGTVGARFARAEVSITAPDGTVRSSPFRARDFALPLDFARPGVQQIEILGDGPDGPFVIANFPLYVGVDEPQALPEDAEADRAFHARGPTEPEVEARALELLNGARADAHLGPLTRDPRLDVVAKADAEDMVSHGFFSHVSPTNGTLTDRLRRAHLLFPVTGENIARETSPERAHAGLMESPGHRANILLPEFTHVGIGAVVGGDAVGAAETIVFEFAREHPIDAADAPRQIVQQLNAVRHDRGLPELAFDDALASAAQQGVAFANDGDPAHARSEAIRKLIDAKGTVHACMLVGEMPDVWRVAIPPITLSPGASKIGVGAVPVPDQPESFRVLLLVGGPKLACR